MDFVRQQMQRNSANKKTKEKKQFQQKTALDLASIRGNIYSTKAKKQIKRIGIDLGIGMVLDIGIGCC